MAILRNRRAPDVPPGAFIDAYAAFVEATLAGREDTRYREWISGVIAARGKYLGCRTGADVSKRLRLSRMLIWSIARHGVRRPIEVWEDEHGLDIDGWHRTVIALVTRIPAIAAVLRPGTALPAQLLP